MAPTLEYALPVILRYKYESFTINRRIRGSNFSPLEKKNVRPRYLIILFVSDKCINVSKIRSII